MKVNQLFELNRVINKYIKKDLKNIKFSYFIAKNKKIVENEIKTILDTIKPSEKYKEYDQKRLDILKKYAKKQENGIYIIDENNNYVIKEDCKEKCNEELQLLKAKYKDIIDDYDKKIEELNDHLQEEINNIQFYKIKFENLPDCLTPEDLSIIMELIMDEPID